MTGVSERFESDSKDVIVPCFRVIRKMLPGGEKVPDALWLPEDDEEDSE